jgi:hypothetical protein
MALALVASGGLADCIGSRSTPKRLVQLYLAEVAMRIEDFDSAHDVEKPADIVKVLSKRRGMGVN